ncbi:MAG: hypothetical protein JGK24_06965 [Microcoleus sp. PH2017_29_MFU_D_A]|uniref:hypothetical protein n=1 Tax=unclassified Microcoleus TaxID=2642155 RepID=UPI001D89093E|nr:MULTISPECIES: hypothetical protein [unclassified Microcoleus]MCC3464452.1 hypothetical protein [Microcoleus sp. PH2017_06_SFM_O_A]MCC3435156.1 hypothetical protein [Microcoleus sp. PH2017_05_CCC_O_A]MCC3572538.1 hypothetical protein [Microcoleus sp. PH2017_34_RAT_O_A]MCC3583825.1 hypothetical protein [Microcoleus sp. PH2017_30_WIL_O_A]MCC3591824.1 hypothetical protein [Microcoleus sp. PH2017_28_MFU_U_A]
MPPQVDQRGMSKVGGVNWRSGWQNLPVFLTVQPRLRGKILSRRFCGRSAATINLSQYDGKSQVSLQS